MTQENRKILYYVFQTLKDDPKIHEKKVAENIGLSIAGLKRALANLNTTFMEIRQLVIAIKILSAYREKIIANEDLKGLDTCGIEPENISKFFKNHYNKTLAKIKEEMTRVSKYKTRTLLTDTEFSTLTSEITFHLYASSKTLKELTELTNKSRAWVIAALKKIPNAIGGNGSRALLRGYSIPSIKDLPNYIKAHDIWVNNWKASIEKNKKTA